MAANKEKNKTASKFRSKYFTLSLRGGGMKNRLQVNLQVPYALAGHSVLPEEKNQGHSTVYTTLNPSSSSVSC